MNIGFVLIPYQRHSGAGEYYHNLFAELIKLDKENRYYAILPQDAPKEAIAFFGRGKCIVTNICSNPGTHRYAQTMLSTAIEQFTPRLDILHCFNFPLPRYSGKVVLTVYDMRQEDLPESFDRVHTMVSSLLKPRDMKRANAITTISGFSLERLRSHFPSCAGKVALCYPGVSAPILPSSSIGRPRANPYILTVGHLVPHKNHKNLILGFNELTKNPDFKHDLVIAGHNYGAPHFQENLEAFVEKRDRVLFLGRVDDEQKGILYKYADLFVFQSLYEGFGFPLFEAFSHRVPVAASKIPVFEELYARPEALFDPYSPTDIAATIDRILKSDSLRTSLVEYGTKRFAAFGWERTAAETMRVYSQLAAPYARIVQAGRD